MGKSYYIADIDKVHEFEGLCNYWKNTVSDMVYNLLKDYCVANSDKYINEDYAENILKSQVQALFESKAPDDITDNSLNFIRYDNRFGCVGSGGKFYWYNIKVKPNSKMHSIYDLHSLKKFLNVYQNYGILDDYGKVLSFDEFRQEVIPDLSKNKQE